MNAHEVVIETAKAAPPVTVVGLNVLGVPISDVAMAVTLLYTAVLLVTLVRDKWYAPWKEGRKNG